MGKRLRLSQQVLWSPGLVAMRKGGSVFQGALGGDATQRRLMAVSERWVAGRVYICAG